MTEALVQVIDQALSQIRTTFTSEFGSGGGSFTEPVLQFVHAVDWSEPWIIGVIVFHILLLLFALRTRKCSELQMVVFLFGIAGIYFAERLNSFLDRHWKSFARQAYFDRHGVFMSTMWSGPLLLISCLVLANSMVTLASMMVQWKRAELKYRARMAQQKTD